MYDMKFIAGLIIFFFLCGVSSAEVNISMWQVVKSDHFIVYYQEAPPGYIDEFITKAEGYYNTIVTELGFTRFEGFWLWDKRCKIYIYKSIKEYQKATGQPAWSGASTSISKRTISTLLYKNDFIDITLPHEMGHLIFREFIGAKTYLPLWLDEGIACLQEKTYQRNRLASAKGLIASGFFIPLEKLSRIRGDTLMMPNTFYAESVSIVEFLLKRYGKNKFVDFCRSLRDNKGDWRAVLTGSYKFKDLSEMNDEWMKYLNESYCPDNS